jgi:hypothetical protein
MTANPEFERLLLVRAEVERACGLLVSPTSEALDCCAGLLESACSDLVSCRPWMSGAEGNPEALAEARRLQEAVRRAGHLLEIARDYYAKWTEAWTALGAGYAPRGAPAATVRQGLVYMTG